MEWYWIVLITVVAVHAFNTAVWCIASFSRNIGMDGLFVQVLTTFTASLPLAIIIRPAQWYYKLRRKKKWAQCLIRNFCDQSDCQMKQGGWYLKSMGKPCETKTESEVQ